MPRWSWPLVFTLVLVRPVSGQFQEVQIAVHHGTPITSATAMSSRGAMRIQADGRMVGELGPNDGLRLSLVNGKITARSLSGSWSAERTFTLVPRDPAGGVRLKGTVPAIGERNYPGAMEVRRTKAGTLSFVSEPPLEEYVAGVVQSEAGNDKAIEYYKLQAVSCRTYALANARKHAEDGFELCDQVHCQVYHGKSSNGAITDAARATRGMVVVDADIRLIHATFHSNCGGETLNAEDVWSKEEPYLRATVDTFCVAQPHATWMRTMKIKDWLTYLSDKYGVPVRDTAVTGALLNYEPRCRDLYLNAKEPLVPLTRVRHDLGLKSTYFRIRPDGEQVVFHGRGFGHGVGLCQEGAMEMARQGRTFTDILHHYYANVHLVDLSMLDFFRDDAQ
ncbi:MAG: SpoIID/LytB domain-containing protein [Flavobacteriales bacterium]|nr:SpoIID/LytB domain-containing protein [Flavobacteriales bacterium]